MSDYVYNAVDAVVKLADAAGTLQDISGSSNTVSIRFSQDTGEHTVFGDDWKIRKVGKKDCTVSLNVVFDTDADSGYDTVRDWFFGADDRDSRAIEIYVPDDSAGSEKFSGEVVLQDMPIELDSSAAQAVMVAVELPGTGTWTHAVVAS